MIFKENKKYFMILKSPISYLLNLGLFILFFGLAYSMLSIPHQMREGIMPKIDRLNSDMFSLNSEIESRIDAVITNRIMPSAFKGGSSFIEENHSQNKYNRNNN